MMRILVTGATGMLGRALRKQFEIFEKDFNSKFKFYFDPIFIGSSDADLTNINEIYNFFVKFNKSIDVIIHLAAKVGGIKYNMDRPAELGRDNLMMGINLLEACRIFGIKKFYMASTVCSYPLNCPSYPFKEEDLFSGISEKTNRYYSDSKKMICTLFDAYRIQYGFQGGKFIFANLYGPNDKFHLNDSHVVPALIKKFIDAKKNNDSVVCCWGNGKPERDFLHVDDAARAICLALLNDFNSEQAVNIGTGNSHSIAELARYIADELEFDGEIKFTGEVSNGQLRRKLDVSKAKQMFDFEAKIGLKEGLKDTIKWYMENNG